MRTPPHILHIIYRDGSKVHLNLSSSTPEQRQAKLRYWANTSATLTAFLAWK